jgi:3-phytase
LVSDQQAGEFVVFNAADHSYVHRFNLGTQETDGCEVTTASLGPQFPEGLFVAMNDNRNFYFYDWGPLRDSISKAP